MPARRQTTNTALEGAPIHHDCRIVAVMSGKGGVGKTTIAVNVAAALSSFDQRVVLIDGDFGLGNVDLLLGLEPERTVAELLCGEASLEQVVIQHDENLQVLPATTGMPDVTHLSNEQQGRLDRALASVTEDASWVIVDTPSGISDNVLSWLDRVDEIILVTTPDRAAWVDAYAVLKLAARRAPGCRVSLLVNETEDATIADDVHRRLSETAGERLGAEVPLLGHIAIDELVPEAARRGVPLVTLLPQSAAGTGFRSVARRLLNACGRTRTGDFGQLEEVAEAAATLEPVG